MAWSSIDVQLMEVVWADYMYGRQRAMEEMTAIILEYIPEEDDGKKKEAAHQVPLDPYEDYYYD